MSLLTKSFTIFSHVHITKVILPAVVSTQLRNYAARKGTRERKAKLRVKFEEKKLTHAEKLRQKLEMLAPPPSKKFDDSWKRLPTDDAYPQKYYQWKTYDFQEAVLAHRETHHPEMYNQPNAYLNVTIDLNMKGEKKNRFMDNFTRVCAVPHPYEHGEERTILAFTKAQEVLDELRQVGATLAGGSELIKQIQNGDVSVTDFQYVVAHPDILPELVSLRGVMKKKFPNVKLGNLDVNPVQAVERFLYGINYSANKDEYEKDFGVINTRIGTLNMDPKHLEENFEALLADIQRHKPKRAGTFITRTLLCSPPSCERFRVHYNLYLAVQENEPKQQTQLEEDDDQEELEVSENEKAVAV